MARLPYSGHARHVASSADPTFGDRFMVVHPADVQRGTAPGVSAHQARHGQVYAVVGRFVDWAGRERVEVRFESDRRAKTVTWPLWLMRHDRPADLLERNGDH